MVRLGRPARPAHAKYRARHLRVSPRLEVTIRRCMRGHGRAVFVGKLKKLLADTVMDRLGIVAGLIGVLPEVTEKGAFTAGRTEWSGIGPMRLADVRSVD